MINVKQYLIVACLGVALERKFANLLGITIATLWVFIVSVSLLSDSYWPMVFSNMLNFAKTGEISIFEKLWFPTSFNSWLRVIETEKFSMRLSAYAEAGQFLIGLVKLAAFVIYIRAIIFLLQSRSGSKGQTISMLTLLLAMILVDSIGGYGLIFIFPFIYLFFVNQRISAAVAVVLCILLVPIDFQIGPDRHVKDLSYLAGWTVHSFTGVTILSYLKPFGVFALLCIASKKRFLNEATNA
jgi:hypothetical protein